MLPVVAALLPPQAAERERLPAPMPGLVRQAEEAGRLMLEWPGALPPAQVWAVQTEEEVLVGARDRQAAVDPPALAQDLLGALSRAMILDEVNFKSFQLLPCPPVGGMGCCCGGPPYGG